MLYSEFSSLENSEFRIRIQALLSLCRILVHHPIDRLAGEADFCVVRLVDFHDNFILARVDDRAENAADGLHPIALLDVAKHVLRLFLLAALALAAENQEDGE